MSMPFCPPATIKKIFAASLLLWTAAFAVPSIRAGTNDDCLMCHGQPDLGPLHVDAKGFSTSIHGKVLCVSCHQDAKEIPHPEKLAPVSCSRCHRVESQIYLKSDHGRAMSQHRNEGATCKDCHGHSHTLLNARDSRSPVNRKNIVDTCGRCHADAQRMAGVRLTQKMPVDSYKKTVHGKALAEGRTNAAVCSDCHGTHDIQGAANPLSRVYRPRIPDTCERCHENVTLTYKESVHGRASASGIKEAPVCTDCHGEHTILSMTDPESSTYVGAITATCSSCHTSAKLALKLDLPADRLKTYKDSYHGMAAERGDRRVANCSSCHGFHDVLPSSDPRSSIYRDNLPTTCGQCHPGAGPRLSTGYVHGPPAKKHMSILFVRRFYVLLILLTVGLMFLHNALDWVRKAWGGHGFTSHEDSAVRMTVNERWQHAVLALSFVVLAYSGFATKFADQPWTRVLAPFSEDFRRALHRWGALAFCVLSVYHLAYMTLTKRGRWLLKAFWPKRGDFKMFWMRQSFNLGLRKTPPAPAGFYNYVEKIEYWALLWGTVVMAITGFVQLFTNLALRFLPLWAMDLAMQIHYYEAVLACLAIVVWHVYGVMFDPDVYPMNWSWLIGCFRRSKRK